MTSPYKKDFVKHDEYVSYWLLPSHKSALSFDIFVIFNKNIQLDYLKEWIQFIIDFQESFWHNRDITPKIDLFFDGIGDDVLRFVAKFVENYTRENSISLVCDDLKKMVEQNV